MNLFKNQKKLSQAFNGSDTGSSKNTSGLIVTAVLSERDNTMNGYGIG